MDAPMFQVLVEQSSSDEEHEHLSDLDLEGAELLDEASARPQVALRPQRALLLLALGAGCVLALLLGAMAVGRSSSQGGPVHADVEATMDKSAAAVAAYDAATMTLETLGSAGANIESVTKLVQTTNFTDIYMNINSTLAYLGLKGLQLKRPNNLKDGNICPNDEEEFEGLCYQTCTKLTTGGYPIRTSAFSCCMRQPCSFFNSKFTNPLKFCQGLDVGGHDRYGCPHSPGDCLINEEFHMGMCYKACALLTEGAFPYRSSATSCCSHNDYAECLEYENVMVSANFSIGGGAGDELLEAEMGMVHPPVPALAEE